MIFSVKFSRMKSTVPIWRSVEQKVSTDCLAIRIHSINLCTFRFNYCIPDVFIRSELSILFWFNCRQKKIGIDIKLCTEQTKKLVLCFHLTNVILFDLLLHIIFLITIIILTNFSRHIERKVHKCSNNRDPTTMPRKSVIIGKSKNNN